MSDDPSDDPKERRTASWLRNLFPAVGARRGDAWRMIWPAVAATLLASGIQFFVNWAWNAAETRYWERYSKSVEAIAVRHPEVFRTLAK